MNNVAVNIQVQIFVWTCFRFSWVNKILDYLFKQLNISYREILKEDESGSLKATIEDILFKAKRKRVFEHHGQVQLGMMCHLHVVVDG